MWNKSCLPRALLRFQVYCALFYLAGHNSDDLNDWEEEGISEQELLPLGEEEEETFDFEDGGGDYPIRAGGAGATQSSVSPVDCPGIVSWV